VPALAANSPNIVHMEEAPVLTSLYAACKPWERRRNVKKVFIKSISKVIRNNRGRSIGRIRLNCRVEMKMGTKPSKF
jgi:hypothetical protein